mmetsp:Transcript_22122/g.48487  ORF Transcript_22122/g.48487 Transcript_22122/m.48487 type:complete len:320 (-) Transcript_22122:782-1741(-)
MTNPCREAVTTVVAPAATAVTARLTAAPHFVSPSAGTPAPQDSVHGMTITRSRLACASSARTTCWSDMTLNSSDWASPSVPSRFSKSPAPTMSRYVRSEYNMVWFSNGSNTLSPPFSTRYSACAGSTPASAPSAHRPLAPQSCTSTEDSEVTAVDKKSSMRVGWASKCTTVGNAEVAELLWVTVKTPLVEMPAFVLPAASTTVPATTSTYIWAPVGMLSKNTYKNLPDTTRILFTVTSAGTTPPRGPRSWVSFTFTLPCPVTWMSSLKAKTMGGKSLTTARGVHSARTNSGAKESTEYVRSLPEAAVTSKDASIPGSRA